jgi:hypothetical protein
MLTICLCLCLNGQRGALLRATWEAICTVESNNRADAVGDGGRALGPGQLHRIYVDDANRILGRKAFTYRDRLDREQSRRMFEIVSLHYARDGGPEQWARIHNGGPSGPAKKTTIPYWIKVRSVLQSKKGENPCLSDVSTK